MVTREEVILVIIVFLYFKEVDKMKELKKLLDVRSIMSLCATFVFVVLSFKGVFDPDTIMNVILIVFSFYLGRTTGKEETKKEEDKDV